MPVGWQLTIKEDDIMKNKVKQILNDWVAPLVFVVVLVWILIQIAGVVKP